MNLLPVQFAHAFGQTYTLPIPLWLFLFGAAASIIVSFVVISWVASAQSAKVAPHAKAVPLGWVIPALQTIGVVLFWLTVASGLMSIGTLNFAVFFFWIIYLIGFIYVTALVGDLWQYLNPLRTMFVGLERLLGTQQKPLVAYPAKLSYYPALLTYVALIWLELMSGGAGIVPDRLAYILICYATITIVAAWIFGKNDWFKYGEFFSVFFSLVARLSSVNMDDEKVRLRRPFAAVSSGDAVRTSMLLIILLMLASTAYDTFRETTIARDITEVLIGSTAHVTWVYELSWLGAITAGLLALYIASLWVMRRMTPTKLTTFQLMQRFGLSLLPIAVGYHAAHYFPVLLVAGPQVLTYLGDPFQFGWNIAGLTNSDFSFGPFDTVKIWYVQISLIIVAHIAALYAAHHIASELFRGRKAVVRSQYPMVALMIVYTTASLWILMLALSPQY